MFTKYVPGWFSEVVSAEVTNSSTPKLFVELSIPEPFGSCKNNSKSTPESIDRDAVIVWFNGTSKANTSPPSEPSKQPV